MKHLITIIGLLLFSCFDALAIAPLCTSYLPTSYYIIGNTNPTTQVMNAATGTMVANNNAGYLTWLAGSDPCQYATITNSADNGSGAIRLTVQDSSGFQSNQYWTLYGSGTVADGTYQITVIDGTHIDLIGSIFGSAFTTGGLYGSTTVTTIAAYWTLLNSYNLTVNHVSSSSSSSAADITLTNPIAVQNYITLSTSGKKVVLPAMNLPGSPPIGFPFYIAGITGTNSFDIYTSDGLGLVTTVRPESNTVMNLSANTTANGTFGVFAFGSVGQLPGVNTSVDANLGNVGEYKLSTIIAASAVGITTSSPISITNLTFTAGDWDLYGLCNFSGATPTTVTFTQCSISGTNGAIDQSSGRRVSQTYTSTPFNLANELTMTMTPVRLQVTAGTTTTIYLVLQAGFGASTMSAYGSFQARRRR